MLIASFPSSSRRAPPRPPDRPLLAASRRFLAHFALPTAQQLSSHYSSRCQSPILPARLPAVATTSSTLSPSSQLRDAAFGSSHAGLAPADLPLLDAAAFPRRTSGQLWSDPSAPVSSKRRVSARSSRVPLSTASSSSTVRPSARASPSSSSSGSDPETPVQEVAFPEPAVVFTSPLTPPIQPACIVTAEPTSLGSFPRLFDFLRAELAALSPSSSAADSSPIQPTPSRPPVSFKLASSSIVHAAPKASPRPVGFSDSDSDAQAAGSTPKARLVRRSAKSKSRSGDIFALPSFADLAVPRPAPARTPTKGRSSSAASVMLQLRSVEDKLVAEWPDDAARLRHAIDLEHTYLQDGVPRTLKEELEVRQRTAQKAPAAATASDRPVHVFVDHSNILVGLISQLDLFSDGSTPLPPGSKARLSHLPLSLILTRGRPALTLALVGSSPLWQPLDELESRGYDVCLLQRVRASLDVGPSGASSAEEDSAGSSSHRRQRAVMKEQAVDEMLQLKMLLAIALFPPGTMVIATGDSAGSHLNPLGFAGIAELALAKGWEVELCAWASSIGRSWKDLARRWGGSGRTPAAGARGGRMVIRELDTFREELEEI